MDIKSLRPHPSGRPKTEPEYRSLGFARPVRMEPLTPGLQKGWQKTAAIGFYFPHSNNNDGQ